MSILVDLDIDLPFMFPMLGVEPDLNIPDPLHVESFSCDIHHFVCEAVADA